MPSDLPATTRLSTGYSRARGAGAHQDHMRRLIPDETQRSGLNCSAYLVLCTAETNDRPSIAKVEERDPATDERRALGGRRAVPARALRRRPVALVCFECLSDRAPVAHRHIYAGDRSNYPLAAVLREPFRHL
jgi:hypothetical protein